MGREPDPCIGPIFWVGIARAVERAKWLESADRRSKLTGGRGNMQMAVSS